MIYHKLFNAQTQGYKDNIIIIIMPQHHYIQTASSLFQDNWQTDWLTNKQTTPLIVASLYQYSTRVIRGEPRILVLLLLLATPTQLPRSRAFVPSVVLVAAVTHPSIPSLINTHTANNNNNNNQRGLWKEMIVFCLFRFCSGISSFSLAVL